jgi:hypothetical protein
MDEVEEDDEVLEATGYEGDAWAYTHVDDEITPEDSAHSTNLSGLTSDELDLSGAPVLELWQWTPDGSLCGYVHGKAGFRDGELMTTSIVPPEGRFETHVVCRRYPFFCHQRLGDEQTRVAI